jgi:hypothetical protein
MSIRRSGWSDHPLRPIREIADAAMARLSSDFGALHTRTGRPSSPPEMLLRAMLLQAFYAVCSERRLMERLEFDLIEDGGEHPASMRSDEPGPAIPVSSAGIVGSRDSPGVDRWEAARRTDVRLLVQECQAWATVVWHRHRVAACGAARPAREIGAPQWRSPVCWLWASGCG